MVTHVKHISICLLALIIAILFFWFYLGGYDQYRISKIFDQYYEKLSLPEGKSNFNNVERRHYRKIEMAHEEVSKLNYKQAYKYLKSEQLNSNDLFFDEILWRRILLSFKTGKSVDSALDSIVLFSNSNYRNDAIAFSELVN